MFVQIHFIVYLIHRIKTQVKEIKEENKPVKKCPPHKWSYDLTNKYCCTECGFVARFEGRE